MMGIALLPLIPGSPHPMGLCFPGVHVVLPHPEITILAFLAVDI